MKIGRDAEHGRGLMNEAVKIGSYEDDDYHVSSILHHVSCIQGFQLFQHAEGLDF